MGDNRHIFKHCLNRADSRACLAYCQFNSGAKGICFGHFNIDLHVVWVESGWFKNNITW